MEDNSFISRLKRYAQVGTSMSSSALRMLGDKYMGVDIDHQQQAKVLMQALGQLKGPIMKVAQFLATVPDVIPEEYVQQFTSLQSQAPPMSWLFVKRRMKVELGNDWIQSFQDFEQTASAAASLGQVHKATDWSGIQLACKLQYPDMTSIVEADLQQLKLIFKIYEATTKALSIDDIYTEITDRLREELDYQREAQHLKIYQRIFSDQPLIHVPHVYTQLSTKRLLTMSWLDGAPLKSIMDQPDMFRNKAAALLFQAWYQPFYGYGFIHGDPHLGNYSFKSDGSVNIYDLGCVRRFSGQFVQGVINLYQALRDNKQEQAVEAYRQWGFQNLSHEMIETLNIWAYMLYEPLIDDRVRPIQTDNRGFAGRETAQKVHLQLKMLGGVKPPREFVFMDRAAVGIGSVFMHLRAEQNWHQLFEELIADFTIQRMEDRQAQVLHHAVMM